LFLTLPLFSLHNQPALRLLWLACSVSPSAPNHRRILDLLHISVLATAVTSWIQKHQNLDILILDRGYLLLDGGFTIRYGNARLYQERYGHVRRWRPSIRNHQARPQESHQSSTTRKHQTSTSVLLVLTHHSAKSKKHLLTSPKTTLNSGRLSSEETY
jgi:hypothetical protein